MVAKKKSTKAKGADAKPKHRGSADAKAPKPARPKQTEIPGAFQKIPELDTKAEEYADVRDERMKLTTQEVELKEELLKLMKKHNVQVYRLDEERIVEIVHEDETVKVRKAPIDKPVKPKAA